MLSAGLRNNEGTDLIDLDSDPWKSLLPLQQNRRKKIMPKRFYDVMWLKVLRAGV